jgi:hypothetical protein
LKYNHIKLASPSDIAAMKISAITGRGSKKDFVDLYFLLQQYSLKEIFHFYSLKYRYASEYLALNSLRSEIKVLFSVSKRTTDFWGA